LFDGGVAAQNAVPAVAPHTLNFAVEWKGIAAGTTTLELKQTSPNNYVYVSTSVARGLARLFVADAVTQTSQFRVENGAVIPTTFRGIDEKDRETRLEFDWTRVRVSGIARGHGVDLALEPGTQDPMSLQMLTIRELAAGQLSPHIHLIDGDKLKEFEQCREGTARLKTALGTLDTIIVVSQRKGSDRMTRTWYAPSIGYLPVQAQRLRDGKVEVTLRIKSLRT
jgi:hypothetical protein